MSTLRNSVRLTGFVGADPEVKSFGDQKKVARVRIATNEVYRDINNQKIEQTQWHQLVCWGRQADIAEKFIQRGKEIAIEGKLSSHSYEAKDGTKRYVTEVIVNEIVLLGIKRGE